MSNEELEQIKQSAIAKLQRSIYHLQEGGDARQALSWCIDAKEDLHLFLGTVMSLTQGERRGLTKRALDAAYCRCPKEIRIWHDGGCRNCGKPIPPRK